MALGERQLVGRVLDALADHVQLALEPQRIGLQRRAAGRVAAVADKQLLDDRHRGGARPRRARAAWWAPGASRGTSGLPRLTTCSIERPQLLALAGVARQEDVADAVLAGRRQADAEGVGRLAEEPIGRLDQDAGAVTRVGLAAARAAVLEVDEDLEPALDDGVRADALDVDDEPDAARVVFVARVIQALGLRRRQIESDEPWLRPRAQRLSLICK